MLNVPPLGCWLAIGDPLKRITITVMGTRYCDCSLNLTMLDTGLSMLLTPADITKYSLWQNPDFRVMVSNNFVLTDTFPSKNESNLLNFSMSICCNIDAKSLKIMHYKFENAIWFLNFEGTFSVTSARIPGGETGRNRQSSLTLSKKRTRTMHRLSIFISC